jgi:hypothetical protein
MALTTEQFEAANTAIRGVFLDRLPPPYPGGRDEIADAMVEAYTNMMFLADRYGLDTSTLVSVAYYRYRRSRGYAEVEEATRSLDVNAAAAASPNESSARERARRKRDEAKRKLARSRDKPSEPGQYDEDDLSGLI